MSDRYADKPFLELLDCYVLDAIGALDAESDATLTEYESEMHEMFGETGSWREIVVARMQFPAGMQGAIREVWEKGRTRFLESQGREPDPIMFARTFIDKNFPH